MALLLPDLDDDIPRNVVVTRHVFAAGTHYPLHAHVRGQFAMAGTGAISVATPQGRWLVPPRHGCWILARLAHEMTMSGEVVMLNVFIAPDATLLLPSGACVLAVSPLLRELVQQALQLPALYDLQGRGGALMALLPQEIAAMPSLPLHAPLPADPRLARVCRGVFLAPTLQHDLDAMAAEAMMSRRTFTRLFREQTGVSVAQWRQQACLLAALLRLADGQPVTRVALDLGYASPSAFSAAFRRVLGQSPRDYLQAAGAP
ncbi:MAG: HTH-type transcriptional regulator NimR [Stenotrophomonas maltophilia]|uniref:HTH-type transcriptional regulator NimR n=1 Tax=Stenotrophomonas maltophilia TaxID=40324 RepID=A0A7V8FJ12_STEMA|nr:MAG: HTH-type transcriptional regulator NimR [Stenotrophomonas maltophilia]